jgi:hypothetical protein
MNRVVHAISRSPAIQVEVIGIEDAASQYLLHAIKDWHC